MLSPETIERYRRMTVAERWRLTMDMTDESMKYLLHGSPEVVKRRFERIRQENDERNHRMLTRLAESETRT